MSGQSFVYGTAVLLASSIFNRAIGLFYQILMMRLLKPEGVGLFNMVFPIYVMALVLATMGIPVAVSKLVAEEVSRNNLPGANRIFRVSMAISFFSGLLFTLIFLLLSPLLLKYLFPNPDVILCFICLIPGVFIVALSSVLRGYFQGLQQMSPTAISQAVEQLIRVTIGLAISWALLPRGIIYASVGISLGVVFGELSGFILMAYIYFTRRPPVSLPSFSNEPITHVLKRIFNLGAPITVTRFISAAMMSLDAVIIPKRLMEAGMSVDDATSTYGGFVGIAETLLFSPSMVTVALATALIPAVSDALVRDKVFLLRARIEEAFRITVLVGSPVAAIFFVLPHELCRGLFGYGSAGDSLFLMALSSPFLYLNQTFIGILQGLGKAGIPFKNLLLASGIKLLGIYYLTAIPDLGILGTALVMGIFYIIMSIFNFADLKRITGLRINYTLCVYKPIIATAAAAFAMLQIKSIPAWSQAPELFSLLLILACGFISYCGVLFIIGGLNASDIKKIRLLFLRRH